MKRLIKGSNEQIIQDVQNLECWTYGDHHSIGDDIIQGIIDRNNDCIYSGILYRQLIFHDNIENLEITDELLDNIHQRIKMDNRYQSFSKSYKFLKDSCENGDFYLSSECVIIQCNSSGLDVNKFANKYNDIIQELKIVAFNAFRNQEEVIAQLSDFEIRYVFGIEV